VLASFGLSALGRLLARKGDPAAGALLERAWRTATQTNSVQAIGLAGIARVEAAWLAGDHRAAAELARVPLDRTAGRGAERYRGGLLRYLARCGEPVRAPSGCPREFALGIQGDWAGAAELWRRLGAPYEEALELAATDRQLEVLGLLAEGLTNAEIADRLVVSVRTVDHHVAAILAKLNVASRREAARAAADLEA
jgi:DNA-binding CsgD family transcriptional regulator